MKVVFIAYNKALTDAIDEILDKQNIRGYTYWDTVYGRGSQRGEPHMGSHAWPGVNSTIITVIPGNKVAPLFEALRKLDSEREMLGLRAYTWSVEEQL